MQEQENVFSRSSPPSPSTMKGYFCQLLDQVIDCVTKPTPTPTATGNCEPLWSYGVCQSSIPYGQTIILPCSNIFAVSTEGETNGTLDQPMVVRYCNETTGNWNADDVKAECFSDNIGSSALLFDDTSNDSTTSDMTGFYEKLFTLLSKLVGVGYGLSLFALLNAIILLLLLRRLHCTRIYIHINLMASFILRGALWILHTVALQEDGNTDEEDSMATIVLTQNVFSRQRINDTESLLQTRQSYCVAVATDYTWCRLYQVALNYCVTANYYWLLVEGLYLSLLLRAFVFSHAKYMKMFLVLGWGMPWLSVLPWLLVELLDEDSSNMCWVAHEISLYWWIIKGPILLSLLINFYIFVAVLCVVGSKLRATAVNQNDDYKWRLTKSTLALIPLLGIQYIITAFWTKSSEKINMVEVFQKTFEVIFISIQGLFVAILYCFLNNEVREECKKKWEAWKTGMELDKEHRRRSTLHTQMTCNLTSKADERIEVGNGHVTPEKVSLSSSPRIEKETNRNSNNTRCLLLTNAADRCDGSKKSYQECSSSAAPPNDSEVNNCGSKKCRLACRFYDSISHILKKTKRDKKTSPPQSSVDDQLSQSEKLLSGVITCNNNSSNDTQCKRNNSPKLNKVIVHSRSDSCTSMNHYDSPNEELYKVICEETNTNIYLTGNDVTNLQETNI